MHFKFVVRFPIHRVVLAGASDYFKTAFSSNWNNNNNNEVTFTVQENEISAFKAVLKFFYTSVIPEDILICEILKMFRLGDALICSFMTQNIERRLAAVSSDLIENNDIVSYFSLNVSIIDCTDLDQKFQQLLAARLGSLHRISLHDCLPQQHLFIQSPLRAIIALFSLDQLLITCENEVLKLLITWIARNKPSKENIKELRKCVRVCHLDLTVINEVLEKVDWFGFSQTEKQIVHGYAAIIRSGVHVENSISTPDCIPSSWFKKRDYRVGLPPSFLLSRSTIREENIEISNVMGWCGYDVSYVIELTVSNAITGYVIVTFPILLDEVIPVFVLVTYNVTINGVEYGPFQQFTRDTSNIMWREEPLSDEERNHENGVTVQVRVMEFHS